jgi:pimeloyl-ACP methyl ester carboxylesterase
MHSWKVWGRRAIAVIIPLLACVAALCGAGLLPYFLAAWSASVSLLAFSAACAFAVIVWGGAWLAALIWHAEKRARFASTFATVLTLAFVSALYVLVLRPSSPRLADTIRFNNTRYWQLQTGSRIAYSEYDPPAGVAQKPEPVVFLHGGPGMRVGPWDHVFFSPFAAYGFRVYLFDQAGSGLSDFLPKVRDYTVRHAVEDLEAVRQQIGTDRMILIGHSWGSTLAANYMAKYPNHVAKVVFYSPGPIWGYPPQREDYSRTGGGTSDFPSLRFLAAMLLLDRNPEASQALLPQPEAEQLLVPLIAPTAPSFVCKGDASKLPELMSSLATSGVNPRLNPYVLQSIFLSVNKPDGDPHAALRGNKTPAMILFGECDYLPWSGALDYRRTLSNARTYYVPMAGHFIQFEQPELMRRMIVAFLLDQPDPMPPYSSESDPRSMNP